MMEIQEKRVLDTFLRLVKIRCSSHDEREVADLLTEELEKLGAVVHEDKAGEKLGGNTGNLVADFPASAGKEQAPRIMLTAHMDCVEPCADVHPVRESGYIRSDGTTILGGDDKAGVTAILEALRVVKEKQIEHGAIQVVFAVSEENGVHGSQNLDRTLLHSDMGFTFDTSGKPGGMSYKAPGKNQIHIHIEGKASHAGVAPEKGINAILAAGKLLATAPQGRIDEETTCNVGKIIGGSATNIVAESCDIYYESRSRDKAKLDAITKRICKHFENGAAETRCKITATVSPDYDPYTLDKASDTVKVASAAAESLGFPVSLSESGGGSDANHYNEYGIPTAVMSCGEQNAHTKEECIEECDLYDSARLALAIIETAADWKR